MASNTGSVAPISMGYPIENAEFLDPYDVWTSEYSIDVRRRFYDGELSGKLAAVAIAGADWLFPAAVRKLLGSRPRAYPIVLAQLIMMAERLPEPGVALAALKAVAVPDTERYGVSWGLGFPWMSKNGLYGDDVPFVTHTPYAMEALLQLRKYPECGKEAQDLFLGTWQFLRCLHVMFEEDDQLALSYAPVEEPRIVVNANAYACFAHALHAVENPARSDEALDIALKLARYTVAQQQADGSWYYYADDAVGNFVDCFHSCFVLKNLMKASKLSREIASNVGNAIAHGKEYLDENFYDPECGLVRRFTRRDIRDPYVWDIYDQAEYLGILVDSGELGAARRLHDEVRRKFFARGHWYCRIDILGRRWGKDFARWGIVPFLHQASRLQKVSDQVVGD